jgi:hypothetical protein
MYLLEPITMIEGMKVAGVSVLKMEKTESVNTENWKNGAKPDLYRNPLSPSHYF